MVDICAQEGPARIRELIARGARFDEKDGQLALTREGGHSARRIVHAADATDRRRFEALTNEALSLPVPPRLKPGAGFAGSSARRPPGRVRRKRTGWRWWGRRRCRNRRDGRHPSQPRIR